MMKLPPCLLRYGEWNVTPRLPIILLFTLCIPSSVQLSKVSSLTYFKETHSIVMPVFCVVTVVCSVPWPCPALLPRRCLCSEWNYIFSNALLSLSYFSKSSSCSTSSNFLVCKSSVTVALAYNVTGEVVNGLDS